MPGCWRLGGGGHQGLFSTGEQSRFLGIVCCSAAVPRLDRNTSEGEGKFQSFRIVICSSRCFSVAARRYQSLAYNATLRRAGYGTQGRDKDQNLTPVDVGNVIVHDVSGPEAPAQPSPAPKYHTEDDVTCWHDSTLTLEPGSMGSGQSVSVFQRA